MTIYHRLLAQARRIPQYSFREYFLRRIKEQRSDFSLPQNLSTAEEMLAQLKRIATVQLLYDTQQPLVIEHQQQQLASTLKDAETKE